MLKSVFKGIRIAAVSAAVPATRITAEELYQKFGREIVDKTVQMIGVTESRQSVKKQIASDLGYLAAKEILEKKEIDANSIGVLIVVTQTPDYRVPATAFVLQKRLGLSKNCAVFDINLGCSGFVYGLQTASAMLQSLNCERALLVIGDSSSKLGSSENRASTLLFGDGTTAVLLEKDTGAPDIEIAMQSDGKRYSTIAVPYGEFRSLTYTEEELAVGNRACRFPLMNGTDVFSFSIIDVVKLIKEFLAEKGSTIRDFDCLVLHQANLYMMKQIAKKLKAEPEQLLVSIDRFGNTSGASIPLSLVDHYGEQQGGKIKALMSGFGVGLSWGVISAVIHAADILPMIFSDEYFEDDDIDMQDYNS